MYLRGEGEKKGVYWGTSALHIAVTFKLWVVLLIGRAPLEICFNQSETLPRPRKLHVISMEFSAPVPQMSFRSFTRLSFLALSTWAETHRPLGKTISRSLTRFSLAYKPPLMVLQGTDKLAGRFMGFASWDSFCCQRLILAGADPGLFLREGAPLRN